MSLHKVDSFCYFLHFSERRVLQKANQAMTIFFLLLISILSEKDNALAIIGEQNGNTFYYNWENFWRMIFRERPTYPAVPSKALCRDPFTPWKVWDELILISFPAKGVRALYRFVGKKTSNIVSHNLFLNRMWLSSRQCPFKSWLSKQLSKQYGL